MGLTVGENGTAGHDVEIVNYNMTAFLFFFILLIVNRVKHAIVWN